MDFEYSEPLRRLQRDLRQFLRERAAPGVDECDRMSVFPRQTFRELGAHGFLGVIVPSAYGGTGMGATAYCLLSEELGRLSAGYHHNGIFQAQHLLVQYGTEAQKAKFLPGLASGSLHAATAISEPGMGSSFARIQTFGRRAEGGYVLNGIKSHINDAAEADVLSLLAKTDQGLTMFLLERGTPGFHITRKLDPVGLRSSPIYEFELRNCPIPAENRLGGEGQGLDLFIHTFNFSRLGNASVFLGMAKAALETAIAYAAERDLGTRRITDHQGIRWILAELHTKLEAAELLRNKGAAEEERGLDGSKLSAMAKLYCGDVALETIAAAMRITGSYGCYRDAPFERWLRDAKAEEVAGGPPEVMKNIIANQLLGKERKR